MFDRFQPSSDTPNHYNILLHKFGVRTVQDRSMDDYCVYSHDGDEHLANIFGEFEGRPAARLR